MPTDTIDRELCLALNLWKEGEKCTAATSPFVYGGEKYCRIHETFREHLTGGPCPDLLSDSGFVLLLGALLKAVSIVRAVHFTEANLKAGITCSIFDMHDTRHAGTGPDEKVALRAAAHQLLCPKEKS